MIETLRQTPPEKWAGMMRHFKLALVGSQPLTRGKAPFEDEDFDIWVLNEAPMKKWMDGKRWTASFQMHKPEVYRSPHNYVDQGHWDWLQQARGKPLFMIEADPDVPDSVKYPLQEIRRWSGVPDYEFEGGCSPVWSLLLGLYLGYAAIEVYGMDLISQTEYSYQYPNWAYWVGFARGRKTSLKLIGGRVMGGRQYGYEGEVQIPRVGFTERVGALREDFRLKDLKVVRIKDRLERAMMENKAQLVADLAGQYHALALEAGETAGALGLAERCAEREDPIPRQEFEYHMADAQKKGDEFKAQTYHLGGMCEYVWNVWVQTGQNQALQQLRQFTGEQSEKSYESGVQLGIWREAQRYIREYDSLVQAAGGTRSVGAVTPPQEARAAWQPAAAAAGGNGRGEL